MFVGALSKEGFLIVFQNIDWIWAEKKLKWIIYLQLDIKWYDPTMFKSYGCWNTVKIGKNTFSADISKIIRGITLFFRFF